MEEISGFSSTLFLQGEPIRNLQSPIIQPDIVPIQDFSIDARFATLLTGRPTFQEHFHGSMIPPLGNCHYEELDSSSKWDFNKISGFDPIAMNFDRYRESIFNNPSLSNELSLSLATSRPPSVIGSDQYHHRSGQFQFQPLASGSRYLTVIQDILTRVASYSVENFDPVSYLARVDGYNTFGSNGQEGFVVPIARGRRKDQLLALLQAVDDQYNQCTDEIHTVISAFHAATELDPKIHAQFLLQRISVLYKNLRERISSCILAMGEESNNDDHGRRSAGRDLERRWALQQLKKKEHQSNQQLWRVQRGLPEKSVSVLRTWMFDNFLHPYPKDAEKHLLALKSGLSRSQVSNWFINARVRLWKPMIEEMYAEMNRRKGIHRVVVEEATNVGLINHSHKNCINI